MLWHNNPFNDFEVEHEFERIGRKTMLLNGRRLLQPGELTQSILLSIEDVTGRKAAAAAAARLVAIVTSSEDAIISKDLDGIITSWNNGAEHLFGYSSEDAVGKPGTLLIPEDHLDEEQRIAEQVRRGVVIEHYETVRRRKDGSLLDISLTVSPVRDATGRIIGASKIARDISGRKRIEEALQRHAEQFETLLNGVPLGVYLVDGDFRIRHVSPTTFQDFGDIPDLIGRDFDEVTHIMWPKAYADEIVQRFRHTLDTGVPYSTPERSEQRLDRGVTEIYEWQIHRIPLPDGRYGVVCYFREISARVQAANQLRQYASDLADADRRKDEFLAMMAHELRNPLAPIRTAVHILGSPAAPAAAAAKARAVIDRQIQNMTRLIDDLLDAARITQRKIRLQMAPVDLTAILRRAVEVVQPLLDERGQDLRLALPSEPWYLTGDAVRLEQAFGNVLDNASKYTAHGGHIWLSAHRAEVPDGAAEATVRVRDDGIGIPADLLPHVFDLFTQAGRSPHHVPGLGIGLSLVRRIVGLHGGRVHVESAGLNQGSEFVVALPLLAGAPPGAANEGVPDAQPTDDIALRILVVDDNVDAAESLADLLRVRTHDVRVVHTGRAALDTAAAFLPQVVFLDIRMDDMDGYEVARRLRRLPGLALALIVAVTGFGSDEDRRLAADAGVDRYFIKPLDPAVLPALLASPPRGKSKP